MADIIEYNKISGPFKREVSGPNKNKVIAWDWTCEEFEALKELDWTFTEKIDGVNIRIIWDGHKPEFRGRTDRAQIPAKLLAALTEMFPEELLEQQFGSNPVILFGEGYGAGIQKGGGNYRQDNSFILFDVRVGHWWLKRKDVNEIADSLGIESVPIRYQGTLIEAIKLMSGLSIFSSVQSVGKRGYESNLVPVEGFVGTPTVPLLRRDGSRIIVKLKCCDLYGLGLN